MPRSPSRLAFPIRLVSWLIVLALLQVLSYQHVGKNTLCSIYHNGLNPAYFTSKRDVLFLDGYFDSWYCEAGSPDEPPIRKPIGWNRAELQYIFAAHGKDVELHSCPALCRFTPFRRDRDIIRMYAELGAWHGYRDLFSIRLHEGIFKADELRGYWSDTKYVWVLVGWLEVAKQVRFPRSPPGRDR